MKNIITKLTISLAILFGFGLATVPLSVVSAQTNKDAVCEGVGLTSGSATGCTDPTGVPSVNSTITLVINMLSLVVGVIAVIMIIVGGLKYIISSGDSTNINSAKNTILYAIVGLVVVALAQVIVRFVLNKIK